MLFFTHVCMPLSYVLLLTLLTLHYSVYIPQNVGNEKADQIHKTEFTPNNLELLNISD